ncbi:polysaccharide biosynthesis tyrosine autokinase [Smaragdicoccus niigatensis]|uniref:polysaccharide biosynthesis tyrosine autokinase n=1 Tax=Smaragdicoccus niigatensis TaxID=359359 RepID=UPI00036F9EF5|nr:polysaccharide biosynthesis tyrosine autokinase [Smaragdicoccus niigatensis]
MEFRDYLNILRARWRTIVIAMTAVPLLALGASLLMTPIYQASASLYVWATESDNVNEAYAGTVLSQQKVKSYQYLVTSQAVAERTIADSKLRMTPQELAAKISAVNSLGTVIINLIVSDSDPVVARNLANAAANGFIEVVQEVETPAGGGPPSARVSIIQSAVTPTSPASPNIFKNVELGLLVGLALGLSLAVLRDRLDNRIKSRTQLEKVSQMPQVGQLPYDRALEGKATIDFADARSGSAEAYRTLRTNLQFLDVDHPPRAIVLTSPKPEEGKTTAAINLSICLAEAGNSCLLLEGDIRRPRVTKYMGLVSGVGLTTVLSGRAPVEDVMQQTSYPNLSVIGAGPVPPNPSELLGSQAFKTMLDELKVRFDYVIIDSPPTLLAVDAAILGTVADGVLMIVRHGKVKREELTRSLSNFTAVGATTLGTVLTLVPSKEANAYSDGYYYYYSDRESTTPVSSTTHVRPAVRA